ncbi:MAG: hypothetical protein NC230_04640 [Bacteroides sp.]|nr:hypothetical protein [Bacteroides sp.]
MTDIRRSIYLLTFVVISLFCMQSVAESPAPDFAFPKKVTTKAKTDLQKALKTHDGIGAVRALMDLSLAQGAISADNIPSALNEIDNVAKKINDADIRSILDILKAEIYKQAYSNNRDVYDERAFPLKPLSTDWTEWSGNQYKYKIDSLCNAALSHISSSVQRPISDYNSIIIASRQTSIYYPYLYDFIALKAIDILDNLQNYEIQPAVALNLLQNNDSKEPDSEVKSEDTRRILETYSDLLSRSDDSNPRHINYELMRLEFIVNHTSGSTKQLNDQLLTELNTLYDRYFPITEYSGDILLKLIETNLANSTGDNSTGVLFQKIKEFLKKYPTYWRNDCLKRYSIDFTKPSTNINGSQYVSPNHPSPFKLTLTNINKAKVLIGKIPNDMTDLRKVSRANTTFISENSVSIGSTPPFTQDTTINLSFPNYGRYAIWIDADNSSSGLTPAIVYCTDLALLSIDASHPRVISYNPFTGAPVEDVGLYVSTRNNSKRLIGTTADNASLDLTEEMLSTNSNTIYPRKADDIFGTGTYVHFPRSEKWNTVGSNTFFDLPIYHPGDSVQWTTILYSYSNDGKSQKLLTHEDCRIFLRDANYQTIDSMDSSTDDWGRLAGAFYIPKDHLTGNYSLYVVFKNHTDKRTERIYTSSFMVSDYKMPTFRIIIDNPIMNQPEVGDITLTGKVESYSGVGLPGTKVAIDLMCSPINMWRYSSGSESSVVVDTVETDALGRFNITFYKAALDGCQYPKGQFNANLSATIASGETQTAVRDFRRGGSYMIYVKSPSGNSINADTPFRFYIQEENAYGTKVEKTLKLTIKSINGDFTWSTLISPSNPDVDFSKVPSGVYDLIFNMSDTAEASLTQPFELNEVVIYRSNDKTSPVEDLVWSPLQSEIQSISMTQKEVTIPYAVKYDDSYLLLTVGNDNTIIDQRWIKCDMGMHSLKVNLPEKDNKIVVYLSVAKNFDKSLSRIEYNRQDPSEKISIKLESFRNKLIPGQTETWKFRTVDGVGNGVAGAFIIDLYNSALDAIYSKSWDINFTHGYSGTIGMTYPYYGSIYYADNFSTLYNSKVKGLKCPDLESLRFQLYGRSFFPYTMSRYYLKGRMYAAGATMAPESMNLMAKAATTDSSSMDIESAVEEAEDEEGKPAENVAGNSDFEYRQSDVTLGLWKPVLNTESDGSLSVSFTVPNANTTWCFASAVYDKSLNSTVLTDYITANKPIMVQPNLPRFIRSGDVMQISSLVINNSDTACDAIVLVELFNVDDNKIMMSKDTIVHIESNGNTTVSVGCNAPFDKSMIGYRIKASTREYADGEQSAIPVLSSISPVIETTPFYIPTDSLNYELNLPKIGSNARVTLQYCNNPIWYCVTALPGLTNGDMSTPNRAASAIFSTATAEGILKSYPTIKEALEYWNTSDQSDSTLTSMLQRNADLKTVLLQATPWVVDAMSDTQRMQRLALLFDQNEINSTYSSAIDRLYQLQRNDGGWAWCDGMNEASMWATADALYTLGYLNQLGFLPDNMELNAIIGKALRWYDNQVQKQYAKYPDSDFTSYVRILDLWSDYTPSATGQAIVKKQVQRIVKDWKKYNIENKAIAVDILRKNGYRTLAATVIESIKEYAESSPEHGMWWPSVGESNTGSLSQLNIAANTLIGMRNINPNDKDIDLIRQWLILQKEAQNWGVGSMPSQIIAAIILTSPKWIDGSRSVDIRVDNDQIASDYSDNYLGYLRTDISSIAQSGSILQINRTQHTPAWGAIYCQSQMTMKDIAASSCEALSVEKELFKLDGNNWIKATGLKVGDKVKIQLTIHASRDIQYVAVTDDRAACLEPVEQLPRPIYSQGICFYRENKDATTNMFVTNLPKGTYVITYEMWVNNAGTFSSGIATAQSQYAPELSAHSAGTILKVDN